MNKDMTFCTHKDCCAFDCIRHISQLEDKTLVSMADMYDEDFCPPQPGDVKKEKDKRYEYQRINLQMGE